MYELVNVTVKDIHTIEHDKAPIYLVDTPGFLDHKISEMTIIKSLQEWAKPQTYVNIYLFRWSISSLSNVTLLPLYIFVVISLPSCT